MMPLRMLGALMLVFLHKHVVSDAITTCSTELNPLTLDPPKVIGEYGDSFLVNCTSSDDYHEGMYWTVGSTKSDMEDEKNYIQWPVLLSDWNVTAECRINHADSFECSKNLEIIIYKRPDGVSVSAKNHGLMVEGTEYLLDCDIINVAPVQYLTVMWYREREMLYKQTFNGTDVKPVNVSSTLRLLPDRDYNGSVFRCEAELQLGAAVPMVNRTSSAPYTAVLSYKPEIQTGEGHYAGLEHEFSLDMVSCRVDGNPPPTVQWFYRGKPVSASEPLTRSQSGKYTAVAENILGSSNTSVDITVEYAITTCSTELNPLTLDPPKVIGEYGDSFLVNCTSSDDYHEGMYWTVGSTKSDMEDEKNYIQWPVLLSDWNVTAECRINHADSFECSKNLEIIIYKRPDGVSVSAKNHGLMVEGTEYLLDCDIINVAPVQYLTVMWYREREMLYKQTFNGTDVKPVNVSSTLRLLPDRDYNGSVFRCEAELQLGAAVPMVNRTSSAPYTAVLSYKPEIQTGEGHYAGLEHEFSLDMVSCRVDGNPPPTVQWFYRGKPVSASEPLTRSQSGKYTAVAENILGSSNTSVDITVEYAITTCSTELNPLTLDPPKVIGEYGDSFLVNCTSSDDYHEGMYWTVGSTKSDMEDEKNYIQWPVLLSDWNVTAECRINHADSFECSKNLEIIIYKRPDGVSVSAKNHGLMVEGTEYLLDCDIINVAPVQYLTVMWYREREMLYKQTFNGTDVKPVNVSSTLRLLPDRDYNGSVFRCEAELQLGAAVPMVNRTSSAPYTAVLSYKPEIQTGEGHYAGLEHEFSLDMVSCRVDGNPPPTVQWFYRGKPVSASEPLTRYQSGKYTAVAENILGSSNTSVDITVEYAITTCSTELNPLTLDPPKVIGEYGDSFLVNCTSSDDYHEGMYWTVGSTKSDMEDEKNYIQWPVLLSDWNVTAECRINHADSFECSKNLEIIIYKRPDGVSVSAKNHGLMVEGTEYLLDCDIINVAPVQYLTVMWYREREMLYKQTFNGTDVKPVNVSSTLRLLPDRDYNGSVFRCEAELQLGAAVPMVNRTSSAPYTAVLSYKPEIQTGEGHYAGLEHEFSLDMVSCRVDGNPPPTVQWFYRGKPVSASEPLTRYQSGKYTAVAENILGSSNTSVDITVEYAPELKTIRDDAFVQVGNGVTLSCGAEGSPLPVFTWTCDGMDILKNTKYLNLTQVITNAIYNCTATNYLGSVIKQIHVHAIKTNRAASPAAMTNLESSAQRDKPEIQTGEGHYAGLEHDFSLDMVSCRVDGNPPPTVQWFYRGKPVSASEPLTRSQSGKYTAVAENILGSSNTSVDITVEYRPSFTCQDLYQIQEDGKFQTLCEPRGIPEPDTTWFKYGNRIESPNSWTRHDSGKYTLQAMNKHGTATHLLYIDVLYAPVFKMGNYTQEVTSGEDVAFSCRAEGNPPPDINWEYTSAVNVLETTGGRHKNISITGATSTNAGVYICVAKNKVGSEVRSVSLMMTGKTSAVPPAVIWASLILLVTIIILIFVVFHHKRWKKHRQYNFVPDNVDESTGRSISMTAKPDGWGYD